MTKKIAWVYDNYSTRVETDIRPLLESEGYEVKYFENDSPELLAVLRSEHPETLPGIIVSSTQTNFTPSGRDLVSFGSKHDIPTVIYSIEQKFADRITWGTKAKAFEYKDSLSDDGKANFLATVKEAIAATQTPDANIQSQKRSGLLPCDGKAQG